MMFRQRTPEVRHVLSPLILLSFLFIAGFDLHAQFDVITISAIDADANGYNGNGASYVDFNGDGFDDLTLATASDGVHFYLGTGTSFVQVDLGIYISGDIKQVLWVDVDNDDDLDFFATIFEEPIRLFKNQGDLTFIDVSASCGILQTSAWQTFGASFGDYDNDGDLDVYLNNYNVTGTTTNYLYENNGNGAFSDVTNSCNCSNDVQNTFQSLWYDVNGDGWLDLFVINDRLIYPNALYINNQDGTFDDVSEAVNFDQMIYAMSLTCGDYDNDSDFDMYVTNGLEGNLFLSWQNGGYTDYAVQNGTQVNDVCWGAIWCDYDNNRLQDLYVATYPWGSASSPNSFFVNGGGINFTENNSLIENNTSNVYAPVMGDFQNDGYPDIFLHTLGQTCWLMNNTGGDNHWLKVALKGTLSNSRGIGSRIKVWTDDVEQARFTYCGENFLGQNSLYNFFGLAGSESIDSLHVIWPSGYIDRLYDVPADQALLITEGESLIKTTQVTGFACEGGAQTLNIITNSEASINWSTGESGNSIEVNSGGSYTALAETPSGISAFVEFDVTFNPLPEPSVSIQQPLCFGDASGSINLSFAETIEGISIDWLETESTEPTAENLTEGTYHYTITDTNDCSFEGAANIVWPAEIMIDLSTVQPPCHGDSGQVEALVEGGTGSIELNWYNTDPDNLAPGAYELTATDEHGCFVTETFEITEPDMLEAIINVTDPFDGANGGASISINGGTPPYSVQWSNGETGLTADGLPQGVHSVLVFDENGCSWAEFFSLIDTGVKTPDANTFLYVQHDRAGWTLTIGGVRPVTVELYGAGGQLLESRRAMPSDFLRLTPGVPGIYLLRVTDGVREEVVRLHY